MNYKDLGHKESIILFDGIEDIENVEILFPEPPDKSKIGNLKKSKENQYFERTELPKKFALLPKEDQEKFIFQEWDRRLNGYWFMNNGVLTYMTGTHYFYLNWWKCKWGRPIFCIPEWEYFLHWNHRLYDPTSYGICEMSSRQTTKCFAKGTLVRMYDGTVKNIENITEGELVMGDDSTPRKVHGLSHGIEELFKVTTYSGDKFVCNKSHTLALYFNAKTKYNKRIFTNKPSRRFEPQTYNNVSLEEYLTLKSKHEHLVMYHRGWGRHFKDNIHFIPPYILGVFLGDGTADDGHITNIEPEIISELQNFCDSNNLRLTKGAAYLWRINRHGTDGSKKVSIELNGIRIQFDCIRDMNVYLGYSRNSKINLEKKFKEKYKFEYIDSTHLNYYREELRRLDLINNKHIPKEYFIDSEKNRFELLAGLLDTDGHLSKRATKNGVTYFYAIVQKNKYLAYHISRLARSLGLATKMTQQTAQMKRKDGTKYTCVVWRVSVSGDIHKIPCRVARKICPETVKRNNALNTGFKIESVGEGEYYGFSVDGNHLFLLENGLVVHNSSRAGVIVYDLASRHKNFHAGIQSKTDDDGFDFFQTKIVYGWRNTEQWNKPKSDNTSNPKAELVFSEPASKSKDAYTMVMADELTSRIDYRAANNGAYDGTTLNMYIDDEAGKLPEDNNVMERWEIVRQAMYDKQNSVIRGKSIHTTTVELMDKKGGKQWRKLWNASSTVNSDGDSQLNELGQTPSGLHQHFTPSYMWGNYDRYGFPNIEKNKLEIEMERKQRKGDSLASIKRKRPMTIRECFTMSGKDCHFNADILDFVLERYTFGNPDLVQGNFSWKDGVRDTEVIWTPEERGRFNISHIPDMNLRNRFTWEGNVKVPMNRHLYVAGADPFAKDVTKDTRNSKFGFVIKRKRDLSVDDPKVEPYEHTPEGFKINHVTDRLCLTYWYRPPTLNEACEDILMACVFFGCEVFPEMNVDYVERYFLSRGYGGYLFYKLDEKTQKYAKTAGQSTNPQVRTDIYTAIDDHITKNGMREVHTDALTQAREIDTDMSPYDLFVAWGYAEMAARRNVEALEINNYELTEFFREYTYK